MEMGSGPYGFVTSGITEPGFDSHGPGYWSSSMADFSDLKQLSMFPINLGCRIGDQSGVPMASSTCSTKCRSEPTRILFVMVQNQGWVVPHDYIEQIFRSYEKVEAIHVSGQSPFEFIIQYKSIESAIMARNSCHMLPLCYDGLSYLIVNFCSSLNVTPKPNLVEQLIEIKDRLEVVKTMISDFQASISIFRKEIPSPTCSLFGKERDGLEDIISDEEADLGKNELLPQETWGSYMVDCSSPQLARKIDGTPFITMVNQFRPQMHVEMSSKVPEKNLVAEDKNVVWKPPTHLLKFQGSSYDQDITSEGHMLLRNDSFAEGNDQQLGNSNDWFKAWNGELNFYKCIHGISSAISGNPNNHANISIIWGIFMDHKPEMYVPKEVGYPPPRGSDITLFVSIFRSKYFHRGWEKLHRTLKLFQNQLGLCSEPSRASSLYLLLVAFLWYKDYKIMHGSCVLTQINLHMDCSNEREHNVLDNILHSGLQHCYEMDSFNCWLSLVLYLMGSMTTQTISSASLIKFVYWNVWKSSSNHNVDTWCYWDQAGLILQVIFMVKIKDRKLVEVLLQLYYMVLEFTARENALLMARYTMSYLRQIAEPSTICGVLEIDIALGQAGLSCFIFNDRKVRMFVAKEVGYPPPCPCTFFTLRLIFVYMEYLGENVTKILTKLMKQLLPLSIACHGSKKWNEAIATLFTNLCWGGYSKSQTNKGENVERILMFFRMVTYAMETWRRHQIVQNSRSAKTSIFHQTSWLTQNLMLNVWWVHLIAIGEDVLIMVLERNIFTSAIWRYYKGSQKKGGAHCIPSLDFK